MSGKMNEKMMAARFKAGHSGNLKGRPKLTKEQRKIISQLRTLTLDSYREILLCLLSADVAKLKQICKDPATNSLTAAVGMSLLKAIAKGDYQIIEKIVERIIGKIPDNLSIVSNVTNTVICKVDPEKLREALAEIESEI